MSRVLPILFNTEMVRTILNGKKTVTRRVMKQQPTGKVIHLTGYKTDEWVEEKETANGEKYLSRFKLPYQPGDILYVRETYCPDYFDFVTQYGNKHGYKADYDVAVLLSDISKPQKWIPSIHMPKEAARIWLKVTDVRVEKLKDITEESAKKEGFSCRDEFIQEFLNMYPECTEESWLWVIEYEQCDKPESEG